MINTSTRAAAASPKRIAVGMSGGVDSSAAALILRDQGYDIGGFTLLLCPDASPEDQNVADAKAVCDALGIEHHVIDLRERFRESVIDNFANEYASGRTPNPCIVCNRKIKFGAMLDAALSMGYDAVATGHYARITTDHHGQKRIAKDPTSKDQSYVLWSLTKYQIEHTILPISGRSKEELRELVRQAALPVYSKPDSQDICFIPDGDYVAFLEKHAGLIPQPGNFIDRSGKIIGTHKGTICYTVGQRKGLGGGFPEPMYVVKLDTERNEITLGGEGSQYADHMLLENVNLHTSIDLIPSILQIKHRYSARPAEAEISFFYSDRAEESCPGKNLCAEVKFTQPQRALTPGQSAVFYDGELLTGGGIISKVL